jgi:branched-chain amino acid transport system ATP-binding protein
VAYGSVPALRNLNLKIHHGEFIALIGANGAGKTTLLETILGINKAQHGSIHFYGKDMTTAPTHAIVAAGISLCPEGRGILTQMSVMENLLLGAYHNRRMIKSSLNTVFSIFPIIEERQNQTAGTLSGGQQQMLSIARALMGAPKLLMFDEPSLGLAPLVVNELFKIIHKLSQDGYTVLLSEQNSRKALQYASRGYVFETGRLVLEGRTEELITNQAVVEAYLGDETCPRQNIVCEDG